jgi:hypothetical protein
MDVGGQFSCPIHFTHRERTTNIHGIEGWVGPRVNLDVEARRKSPSSCQESNPTHPAQSLVTILTELPQHINIIVVHGDLYGHPGKSDQNYRVIEKSWIIILLM